MNKPELFEDDLKKNIQYAILRIPGDENDRELEHVYDEEEATDDILRYFSEVSLIHVVWYLIKRKLDRKISPIRERADRYVWNMGHRFFGHNYYVGPKGNDKNDGKTVKTAFRSMGKANEVSRRFDVVYVLPGKYTENVTI